MGLSIDSHTLFKLYYVCLIVVVIAGLAVHFMEAPEAEQPAVQNGAAGEIAHEATPEAEHAAEPEAEHEAEEEGFWWLHIPLFAAGFAFAGGVVLLALAKLGIFPLIKREEDYYDRHSIKKREEKAKVKGGGR
jgi:hypothetical protein